MKDLYYLKRNKMNLKIYWSNYYESFFFLFSHNRFHNYYETYFLVFFFKEEKFDYSHWALRSYYYLRYSQTRFSYCSFQFNDSEISAPLKSRTMSCHIEFNTRGYIHPHWLISKRKDIWGEKTTTHQLFFCFWVLLLHKLLTH